jgi:hypothetical protein
MLRDCQASHADQDGAVGTVGKRPNWVKANRHADQGRELASRKQREPRADHPQISPITQIQKQMAETLLPNTLLPSRSRRVVHAESLSRRVAVTPSRCHAICEIREICG